MTLQQVMEEMQGLQEAMAASRAEQERIQLDLVVPQARNEELCRANEELRRGMRNHPGNREAEDRECFAPPREFPMPFSQSIMEAVIPPMFVGPKVTFTGMEDPEALLTTFHTQMMLVGGSDAVRCKLFMSTLAGMIMDWFISLSDDQVTSLAQLSQLFREQYIANQAPPPVSYDLFDVKQYQGETLKEYINRLWAQVVKVGTTKESMIVYAFRKGICPGPFCESLIRNCLKTFADIRHRTVEHIAMEGEVCEKRASVVPARPRAPSRAQSARVNEAATGMRRQERKRPYKPRMPQARGRSGENRSVRHNFVVELKDLIAVPNIVDRLRTPAKTDKVLGPRKDTWCEFHQAFEHLITNCLALGHQLDELVKSEFLNDYLVWSSGAAALATPVEDQAHEMPIHGEVHTISGGFSGGGCTASQHKRYVRSVNSVADQGADDSLDIDLVFTKADLHDVVPHDNDPVVISVVTAGRKLHRVLVDQGCLYGFAGDQVEVRDYLELRTTFTDGTTSRTENIRYLVVNAKKEAKKCYGNSLKTKRGVFMVVERPPMKKTPMEAIPMEEALAEAVPVEEAPIEAVPGREGHLG
ncbi:uncharacterized protein [Phaseolus vulgaris]|uniref:uncharacterized protein n=1 Tax=Phaseolus vulgaris TaxID=3885 RepID=UPI0035CB3BB6